MNNSDGKHLWGLMQTHQYRDEYQRLPSRFRSQVSRKTVELMYDPTPGGSRTSLKGYHLLCRLRAGDFRVIYAYDSNVVQLMSLRRRNEGTYDHLDEIEVLQFAEFWRISCVSEPKQPMPNWNDALKDSLLGTLYQEPLPRPITAVMLDELKIPEAFRPPLLAVATVDELLDCQQVPCEYVYEVLEYLLPRRATMFEPPTPVVALTDLVDSLAADVSGPLDAGEQKQPVIELREAQYSPAHELIEAVHAASSVAPLVVSTTRRQDPMSPYAGNTARAIAKDAHYTVKLSGEVALLYYVGSRETTLLTTDDHPELVAMVNAAKRAGGSTQDGGRFVINEFRHVLVPNIAGEQVLLAGVYTRDLEFQFEGSVISPVAPIGIRPGDVWPGPHAGVQYTLAAGAADIRYEENTAHGTQRRVLLSDHFSKTDLEPLLQMCRRIKSNGGAIYINEARELFAPVDNGAGYQRRYIGHVGTLPWFPAPAV